MPRCCPSLPIRRARGGPLVSSRPSFFPLIRKRRANPRGKRHENKSDPPGPGPDHRHRVRPARPRAARPDPKRTARARRQQGRLGAFDHPDHLDRPRPLLRDWPGGRVMGSPAAPGAVVVRGLTKRYGDILALDRLDLDVPAGSIFGFLGPNGAGKTTTLRLLTGLGRPTAGVSTVDGVATMTGGRELTRRIGYLDQDPRFYSWLTGRELLTLVGRIYGIDARDLRGRVDEVLALFGLTEAAGRRIGGYSGGMRQRLGGGQAVLTRPAVLFLDEPVSSLDPGGRRDALALIR